MELRRFNDGFELWSDEYVRNESPAASTAGDLRRVINKEIRRLGPPRGRVFHSAYGGERRAKTDIENVLFNNIDQTLSLFAGIGRHGVRFEDLGADTPPSPSRAVRASYFTYRLTNSVEPFRGVALGDPVCRVDEVAIPSGEAGLATRIWLAVRRALPEEFATVVAPTPYALRVRTHNMSPGTSVKAIVDGVSAAMQRWTTSEETVRACARGLEGPLAVSESELVELLAGSPAPLGEANRLFTVHRSGQIRVTPDDDRCLAAEVIAETEEPPIRLSVDLFAVTPRSLG